MKDELRRVSSLLLALQPKASVFARLNGVLIREVTRSFAAGASQLWRKCAIFGVSLLALHSGLAAQPQTIIWTSLATNTVLVWGRAYPLAATSSSGLPVSFRVQGGPAFVAGGPVTNGAVIATNSGSITLVAEQVGNVTGEDPESHSQGQHHTRPKPSLNIKYESKQH